MNAWKNDNESFHFLVCPNKTVSNKEHEFYTIAALNLLLRA